MSPRALVRPLPLLATVAYLLATAAGPGLHVLTGHHGPHGGSHAHTHATAGHAPPGQNDSHAHAGCGHHHHAGHGHHHGGHGPHRHHAGDEPGRPAGEGPHGHGGPHDHHDHDGCAVCQFLVLAQSPVEPPGVEPALTPRVAASVEGAAGPGGVDRPTRRTRGPPAAV